MSTLDCTSQQIYYDEVSSNPYFPDSTHYNDNDAGVPTGVVEDMWNIITSHYKHGYLKQSCSKLYFIL